MQQAYDFPATMRAFPDRQDPLFCVYTIAETTKAIRASGGMQIIRDYTYETAPSPKVLAIPAQTANTEPTLQWIRKVAKTADVTMSVCSGTYLLAKTGLLAGNSATIQHGSYGYFAAQYPDIRVKRGARFVEDGNLATAGGLSSGIELAFRVVERYFGRAVAKQCALDMEYRGQGWQNPDSNSVYTQKYLPTSGPCGSGWMHN